MSTDYGIYCHDCLERLESVASSSIAYGFKVWAADQHIEYLARFMEAHLGHHLIIENDDKIDDIIEDLGLTPPTDRR